MENIFKKPTGRSTQILWTIFDVGLLVWLVKDNMVYLQNMFIPVFPLLLLATIITEPAAIKSDFRDKKLLPALRIFLFVIAVALPFFFGVHVANYGYLNSSNVSLERTFIWLYAATISIFIFFYGLNVLLKLYHRFKAGKNINNS